MSRWRSHSIRCGIVGSAIVHVGFYVLLTSGNGLFVEARTGTGHKATAADVVAPGTIALDAALRTAAPGPATREAVLALGSLTGWSAERVAMHLWESTLIALLLGSLTLLLRGGGAHLRYWLWLAASMKFFVPFSSFVAIGAMAAWLTPVRTVVDRSATLGAVAFTQWAGRLLALPAPQTDTVTVAAGFDWLIVAATAVWLAGAVPIAVIRYRMWRRVRAALRASRPLTVAHVEVPPGVRLRSAPGVLEPGVIGWHRPVLLLPADIESHLTLPEIRAVIAHELNHVDRRDNFTAALHMLTEMTFWFHPMVWWIGSRLVSERERACDEAVLDEGHEPTTYAQAIVNICAAYAVSPIACVAGVTGSELPGRIASIVSNDTPLPLRGWKRVVVTATVVGVVAAPVGYGVLHAVPRADGAGSEDLALAQTVGVAAFDAASVKVNTSGLPQAFTRIDPGGRFTATNTSLALLIRLADEPSPRSRGLEPFEVTGGPNWLLSDRFDVSATAGRDVSLTELRAMLRTLLAERFQVEAHVEKRPGPVYRMSLARAGRLGPQLRRAQADCAAAPVDPFRGFTPGEAYACGYFGPSPSAPIESDRAYQAVRGMTMDDFAAALYPHLRRRVTNETGLSGYFDADVEFSAEIMMPPPPSGQNPFDGRTLPSIFSVLPQQLGLKLAAGTAPVDILVIDRAEHPTEN